MYCAVPELRLGVSEVRRPFQRTLPPSSCPFILEKRRQRDGIARAISHADKFGQRGGARHKARLCRG